MDMEGFVNDVGRIFFYKKRRIRQTRTDRNRREATRTEKTSR